MVENVSLQMGSLTGLQSTSDLDGLDRAETMGRLDAGIGKLETRKASLEKFIDGYDRTLILRTDQRDRALKRAATYPKNSDQYKYYKGEADKYNNDITYYKERKTSMTAHLGRVNHDLGALNGIKSGIKADLQARADLLKSALASGDFQAALGIVLSDRLDNLDHQLKNKVGAMNDRNQLILDKNTELASLKGKTDTKSQKRMTELQGEIDKLNSDSQMDMIKLQSLTNKRNQTFELLSNMTQKFSQSMDKVIGNIR